MRMTEIMERLLAMQDGPYRDFQRRLMPNLSPETILGVRTPQLRAMAKAMGGTPQAERFLHALPHGTFEENQLHAFLIEQEKDFDACLALVRSFLPHVDNWATCDQLAPRALAKDRTRLLEAVGLWLRDEHPYAVRFGVDCLMRWYLDEAFDPAQMERVAALRSQAYYVNMAVAWYFATALAKQYDAALPFIEAGRLDAWTHHKAIQKAVESLRIPPERKAYLRTLKKAHEKGSRPIG